MRLLNRLWIYSTSLLLGATCLYLLTRKQPPVTRYTQTEPTELAQPSSPHKHVTKSLSELGKTPELSAHLLFFNPVPKSGSEMLVLLLQWLQGPNNFRHVRLRGGKTRALPRNEQEKLVDEVTDIVRNKAVPLSFDRHVYFLNFTSFGRQSPTFVNLVRDPVEKLASRFYKRATQNHKNLNLEIAPKRNSPRKYLGDSLEECMKHKLANCTFIDGIPYDLTIPYFCGQNPKCMVLNDPWALKMAKSNVDRYFPVVGVLEELNATLEALESFIPYFFKGVQKVFVEDLFQLHHNRNRQRPKVNDDIRRYFKNIFVCEYDFYEWIKRRLFQRLQMLYGHNH